MRVLRRRIGFVSAALADQLRPALSALDAVRTARYAALEPWWHRYTPDDDERARDCLDRMGVGRLADHTLGTLSSGERTRVLLARSLMNDPAIVLLDEPASGLDLAGREQLVEALDDLAADPAAPPFVVVTHHVEDVPTTLTHALLIRGGSGRSPRARSTTCSPSDTLERVLRPRPATGAARRRSVQRVGARLAEQPRAARPCSRPHLVVEDAPEHRSAPQLAGVLEVHRQRACRPSVVLAHARR